RVMTGSSLENTIKATTQAEKILLDQFPEVEQVVSKIGAGEIPTDPMPIEAADLMIILKDKSEWVTASNREELANKMAEALEVIPGVTFGFQQPIQMRFNELMTGVRQDVAVKIYGENLDDLSEYANQIGRIASGVEGAVDLYIEEVTGIPQIVITYKRDQLAKYGLSIMDVNRSVQAAFAGASAGLVYENERRFDLVVRLDKANRNDLESVRNLYISRKDGHQIPLYQVANVEIKDGPYQIQRDDTRRRILVAFNVRNRDVESVVTELRQKIDQAVVFAPGYSISYGGQFENLVEARQRLAVAVPLALLLIFVLLYFTFKSVKQGILIFTAIPLSAIGGIVALYLRGMPFSISAGVGFIALFGVAVLNGIVLISEFNHLKKEGVSDIFERIYQGTKTRLRPVIMTAAVASLGFLPMALSQSGGAEVQKPLATVVIGGLITATFLTLIVLPILYYYFEKGLKLKTKAVLPILFVGVFMLQSQVQAQETQSKYTLDEVIEIAVKNNPTLRAADLKTQQERTLKGASWNLPKTDVSVTHGQYNSVFNNDNQFNVNQSIAFPTVYSNQSKLANAKIESSEWREAITKNELVQQVKSTWYGLLMEKNKRRLLMEQDSIYQSFSRAANLRYRTGETNLLEKATAESQVAEIKVMLEQNKSDIEIYQTSLKTLLNTDLLIDPAGDSLIQREVESLIAEADVDDNPTLAWFRQQIAVAEKEKSLEKSKLMPDLMVGYFNQSLNGPNQDINGNPVTYGSSDRFTGFQVGISIPIFGAKSQASAIRTIELKKQENEALFQSVNNELEGRLQSLLQQYYKFQNSLSYYQTNALPQAELILNQAQKGFQSGDIGYVEYTQGLNRSLSVRFNYLDILNQYNQTIIQIEFISGIQ
ncbi:MAG: efflux RND transporter permease subunit, partial [Marinoscillum sp.]